MRIRQGDCCMVFWGSHGCDGPRGHDGDHECLDEEFGPGYVCSVGQDGKDNSGFQWFLYGQDAPIYEEWWE